MDYKKSLEDLEKALDELREENKTIPIIVEGEKDIDALHKLDINGTIITVNKGISLTDFCDKLASDFKEIIILTDWDRRGGYLCHTIRRNLEGRVNCNLNYRRIFAKNSMIRTIEGLPSWINTIKEKNY
ncbi:MAG: toprim domain-containing protein [Thermoplasmatales archaeon]|nr:toprim domain-containing protein [Thermoplasmatales archaeon]MCK4995307.1 toprim domain-containing protein [Thermoplasmatales archaeon]